jgi:hypothetical protein
MRLSLPRKQWVFAKTPTKSVEVIEVDFHQEEAVFVMKLSIRNKLIAALAPS